MTTVHIYDDTAKVLEELYEKLDMPVHEIIDTLVNDYKDELIRDYSVDEATGLRKGEL